jgi:soluble lytic murein transglycosylase-like protein
MGNMKIYKSRILVIVLFVASIAASVQAQAINAPDSRALSSKSQEQVASGGTQPKEAAATAALQYQSSLKDLAASYDEGLKRLTDQNAKIKELFDKGLVSRREVEQSDSSVADARAKVEGVQKEIAAANVKPLGNLAAAVTLNTQDTNSAWSTGNKQVDELIRSNGVRYGVDPYLIYCLMNQESNFRATAISGKGAQGLMQLMPDTAARYGVTNPYDPAQSIKAGTHYLKDLLKLFDGKVELVLAAYNAGEGTVMKYGNRVPPYAETKYYVRSITARYTGSGLRTSASKTAL